jgi:hypothetical protein
MADSIRQQIISALDTRLKTILVANGYASNVGQHVYEWRSADLEESSLPGIIYRDISSGEALPVTIMAADSKREFPLDVEIDIHVKTGATSAPAQMRSMIADVIKAIGTDPTFSALAVMTEYNGDETSVEQQERTMGSATMRFRIIYRTKLWNPYE